MPLDKIKKIVLLHVPTSICNLRCSYCYLAQRNECYQGRQAELKYTPEQVAKALSKERMGGICYINFTAEGETLLTKDIDTYCKALAEEGHFIEIVTNLTVTSMVDRILKWDKKLLEHIEFKCSFHYLELKRKKLLDVFAENVNKIWMAGASANIELPPSDELIPYIPEIKRFSIKHFGALPHLTITRDDRTKDIVKLTELSEEEYINTWSQFDSDFWKYKMSIFGVRQNQFCYAGKWSVYVNLANGEAKACYFRPIGNIFENPDKPIDSKPIGKCPIAHCYNGHMLLTLGVIPDATSICYGDIRNRVRRDGKEWIRMKMHHFLNTKLQDQNTKWSWLHEQAYVFSIKLTGKIKDKHHSHQLSE